MEKVRDFIHGLACKLKMDKVQATIILCGLYIFFSLTANVAATKVTYFGKWVMDAGFIYSLTFTWRDLIHKQLGRKAAVTTIWLAGIINFLAALYFQWVVLLPSEADWAAHGGQIAWQFLFGLQFRIVIASVVTAIIAELSDTFVYQFWVDGIGKNKPQWTRVFISNSVSIPIDSLLFPIIAFGGVLGATDLMHMFWTNIAMKVIITILVFWTIYLVPEKPIYRAEAAEA